MSNHKSAILWFTNVVSFVLFALLTLTGLINWLILPRGGGPSSVRHFFVDVHTWLAVFFIITIGFHIYLHWGYVTANLKKYKKAKSS